MTDEIVIHDGNRAVLMILAGIGGLSLAALGMSGVALLINSDRGSEWILPVVLPVCLFAGVLLGGLTLRLLRAVRRGRPVLAVNARGIRDASLSERTIPWDQIEYLTWHWWYGKNSAIVLKPGAPYLNGIGLLDRATALLGRLMFMPGFGLMVGPSPGGHERLIAAVRRFRPDLARPS